MANPFGHRHGDRVAELAVTSRVRLTIGPAVRESLQAFALDWSQASDANAFSGNGWNL